MSGKSTKTLMQRFMYFVNSDWQWTGSKDNKGYGRIRVDGKLDRAHRVSYKLFNGLIPDGLCVLHSCDDPGCVNPQHLHIGTHQDNSNECMERGRSYHGFGEINGRAKLSASNVIEIRKLISEGISRIKIAKLFGVTGGMIGHISHNRNWKHLST